jgi:putative hydrolase of the HAD superfamily
VRREGSDDWDEVACAHGVPPGAAWAAFHDVPEYALSRAGRISDADLRAAVVRDLARQVPPETAARVFDDIRARGRAQPAIEPEMEPVLRALRAHGKLGLLTNGGKGSLAKIREWGVEPWFDDVVASGDVGLAKPDPRVFLLAAERLGVDPSACAYVDDLERNVVGAREAGMRAHHHHRTRHADLLRFLISCGALLPSQSNSGQ